MLLPDYLFHFVSKDLFAQILVSRQKGGSYPAVTDDDVLSVSIPLPPLSEQLRIVEILQEAEEIRRLRAEAEAKTAELIPAIFFSHFQNELLSPHSHSHRLADFCANDEDVKCGPFGTQLRQDEFTRGGVPLWGIKHVNGNFKTETDEFVSPEKAEELGSYSLKPYDIVMTRKGTIGNCAIYPDHLPKGIMHSDLLRIRLDSSRFNPVFLSTQLALSPVVERQISSQSAGAVMPGINVTRLKELKLFVVEPQRQKLFAAEVNEVAALHSLEHQSRSDESCLLASLSAHAFSGQLTVDWREAHKEQLAIEANLRDAALKEVGAVISPLRRSISSDRVVVYNSRGDGIYSDLNREQRHLLDEIERLTGREDYGRYFTAEQLAAYVQGPLHRHPQRIESHLAVFAVRGLVIPLSRPRSDSTGSAFAACYRLPVHRTRTGDGDEEASPFIGDDIRATLMATQRRLATGII